MVRIKRNTVEDIAQAARNTYPDEFIALIGDGGGNGIIDELVVLPSTYGRTFSSIRIDLLPFDRSVLGSVHSHPSPNATPSDADLRVFKKTGEIHLIIGYPFNLESVNAFNAAGKQLELDVVE